MSQVLYLALCSMHQAPVMLNVMLPVMLNVMLPVMLNGMPAKVAGPTRLASYKVRKHCRTYPLNFGPER